MRILQILSSSAFHGAEAMTAELVRQLHELGVSVDVAVLDNSGRGNAEIFDRVGAAAAATFRIPCNGQLDFATTRELNRIVADRRIDIIHSHKYKTSFYGVVTRALRPVKVVTTYHNWLYQTRTLRMYAALDKQLARFSNLCVGVSTPVTGELRRHVSAGKVLQIDNGIDVNIFRPVTDRDEAKRLLGFSAERPLVGFVGRLSSEKGLPYLLDAIAASVDHGYEAVIVGDGESRGEIKARIDSLGLAKRVTLLGERRDTPQIYQALDIFVLPSTVEAFPMVVLEAMATGCAVIATAVGEVGRIVEHGISGLVAAPAQAGALQEAIERFLGDRELRQRLGYAARERVVSNFSSRSMASTYLRAYESLNRP